MAVSSLEDMLTLPVSATATELRVCITASATCCQTSQNLLCSKSPQQLNLEFVSHSQQVQYVVNQNTMFKVSHSLDFVSQQVQHVVNQNTVFKDSHSLEFASQQVQHVNRNTVFKVSSQTTILYDQASTTCCTS